MIKFKDILEEEFVNSYNKRTKNNIWYHCTDIKGFEGIKKYGWKIPDVYKGAVHTVWFSSKPLNMYGSCIIPIDFTNFKLWKSDSEEDSIELNNLALVKNDSEDFGKNLIKFGVDGLKLKSNRKEPAILMIYNLDKLNEETIKQKIF